MATLSRSDLELLSVLADHPWLTKDQLACALNRNADAVERRLGTLEARGIVVRTTACIPGRRGRPLLLWYLDMQGNKLLSHASGLTKQVGHRAKPPQQHGHHMLRGWMQAHVCRLQRLVPMLHAQWFLGPGVWTGTLEQAQGTIGSTPGPGVRPDGGFLLTHVAQQKTLLFYVEVDRGTEPTPTIEAKLSAYQSHFRHGLYLRWQSLATHKLRGFRVLLVTETNDRFASLHRVASGLGNCEFVWHTTLRRLLDAGVGGEIWTAGGQDEPRSILGSVKLSTDARAEAAATTQPAASGQQ